MREGLSIQAISSVTGFDRKTVRKYLPKPDEIPAYGPRPEAASKLDGFKPYLEEWLKAGVWNAAVLLRELNQRSTPVVTRSCRLAATTAAFGGRRTVAVRRFETPPGRLRVPAKANAVSGGKPNGVPG
jgi:transposase